MTNNKNMYPTNVVLLAISRVVAPRLCAIRAFLLNSHCPLSTTTALPFTTSGLTPVGSHSQVEVIFTKGYCNWKSKEKKWLSRSEVLPLRIIITTRTIIIQHLQKRSVYNSNKIKKNLLPPLESATGVSRNDYGQYSSPWPLLHC